MKLNYFLRVIKLPLLMVLLFVFSPVTLAQKQELKQELKHVDLQEDWGIAPVHVRLTAGGYMIEFRYKVLDVEKALILSDRKDYPYLLSMKSRAKFSVPYFPTVGFVKSNRRFLKPNKNYIAMFSNEGQHMLKGDKVKIQVKNQVSPELVVQ